MRLWRSLVVAVLDVLTDVDEAQPLAAKGSDRPQRVLDLGLGVDEDRGMAGAGVRAHQDEPVGEARDGHALVGDGAVLPDVVERASAAADDRERCRRQADVEARREDDHVELALGPSFVRMPTRLISSIGSVTSSTFGTLEASPSSRRRQDALAAELEVPG